MSTVVAIFTAGIVTLCALFSGLIGGFSTTASRFAARSMNFHALPRAAAARYRAAQRTVDRRSRVDRGAADGASLLLGSCQTARSTQDIGLHHAGRARRASRPSRCRCPTPPKRANLFDTLSRRVRSCLPGVVEDDLISQSLPGQGYWGDCRSRIVKHPLLLQGHGSSADEAVGRCRVLATMGITLLHGPVGLRLW